jgi:hypothetical protein
MTVRVLTYEPDYDVVPQAIIWRPLRYFTLTIRDGQDGLDKFKAASFAIGNEIRFDLRVYRGHPSPEFTVSLYLPSEVTDEKRISEVIDIIIEEMVIPMTAIAWRRGQPFEYGKLERPARDRLGEREARLLVLKIAAEQSDLTASVKLLQDEVPKHYQLSSGDQVRSETRSSEQLWHQIIRNVTSSHQKGGRGLFALGLAEKTPGGIKVTDRGMDYLNSIGFSNSSTSDFDDE